MEALHVVKYWNMAVEVRSSLAYHVSWNFRHSSQSYSFFDLIFITGLMKACTSTQALEKYNVKNNGAWSFQKHTIILHTVCMFAQAKKKKGLDENSFAINKSSFWSYLLWGNRVHFSVIISFSSQSKDYLSLRYESHGFTS